MSILPSSAPSSGAVPQNFEAWIESLRLPSAAIGEARQTAARKRITLERAVIDAGLVDFARVGAWYAGRLAIPYAPLAGRPAAPAATRALSPECAREWQVFPWNFEEDARRLIVAVHTAAQIEFLRRLRMFFLLPFELGFTAASPTEIEACHAAAPAAVQPKGTAAAPAPEAPARPKVSPTDKPRGLTAAASAPSARPGLLAARPGLARVGPARENAKVPTPAYGDMARAVLSTASTLLQKHFANDPDRLACVRSQVRYCELMASRMGLAQPQTDGLLLAAWLSGAEGSKDMILSISTPYGLEQILYPDRSTPGSGRIEATILDLVHRHQQLAKQSPAAARDVGLTRRELRRLCPGAPDAVVETFLQLLIDEQFLSVLDRSTGRILIVDPAETRTPRLSPPLTQRGYTVDIVADAGPAMETAAAHVPDLILCELDLPRGGSASFCQSVKANAGTANVPVILVAQQGSEARAAESLRAGADDLLPKPVDLELMLLKIERCLELTGKAGNRAGMSGHLSDMALSDMVQILCSSGRNMEITLTRGSETASVFIREGEVLHAEAGSLQGAEAFYALLRWDSGEFTARARAEFPDRTIRESVMSLLMEGARRTDEAREQAVRHPPAGT